MRPARVYLFYGNVVTHAMPCVFVPVRMSEFPRSRARNARIMTNGSLSEIIDDVLWRLVEAGGAGVIVCGCVLSLQWVQICERFQ